MNLSSPYIPLQILASQYRTQTHQTENQLRQILRAFINLKNNSLAQSDSLLQMLQTGKQKLISLKRRLNIKFEQQSKLYDSCKKRLHKQQQLKENQSQKANFQLDSQIIQYLRSQGEIQRANALSKALKEEDMHNLDTKLLEQMKKICQQITQNNLITLKQWVKRHNHDLDKNQSCIYFDIICCDYVNLIIKKQPIKACNELRKGIKNLKLTKNQHNIIQKLTYFFIQPCNQISHYLKILQDSFRKAFTQIYLISFDSILEKNLVVGISSLKTICCCKQSKNPQICPICVQRTNNFSAKIPMLTKQSSSLKCRINQSIMNEQNCPMFLPSGNIYSLSGLNETSRDNKYYCINTQTWYPISQAKKVFIA